MKKTIYYSAKCPFCDAHHRHAQDMTDAAGQIVTKSSHSFLCCGHEFGFSVRRTLAAYLVSQAGGAA